MADLVPDYRKAAVQRLAAAEVLLREKHNLDAMYLGGYAIECALKALILARTADSERIEVYKKIRRGSAGHQIDNLTELLKDRGSTLPPKFVKRIQIYSWGTALRYSTDPVPRRRTRGFLKLVASILSWAEGETP